MRVQSNVHSVGDDWRENATGYARVEEITILLNASRADCMKNITYVKYEVCQLVESASSLLALDIARESKVSALGLKFLGPARRFTRSRGYRLSSQEVMPSSRREYQILRTTVYFLSLHVSSLPPLPPSQPLSAYSYSSPCPGVAPQIRTSQSFGAEKSL